MNKKGIVAGLMLATALVCHADIVINYQLDTSSMSANQLTGRSADTSSGNTMFVLDTANPFLTGPGTNTTVYGAMSTAGINTQVMFNASNGRLSISGVTSMQGLVLWDKSSFLSGSSQTYGVGAGSSISVNLFQTDGSTRFIIRNGDTYYISEMTVTSGTGVNGGGTTVLDGLTWAEWDPAANGGTGFTNALPTVFSTQTFNNVTAVGIYFDGDRSAVRFRMENDGFIVNLDIIPEPASIGFLLFGMTAVIAGRRMKNRMQ